ncbi:lipase [Carnobacterium maltaromaticum]|nr:lipase [Carnobacterium maltaromaticum]
MSISDKEYNKISDTVYWIDIKHKDYNPDITEGSVQKIAGQSYKVLKLKDSKENGMQAMAVAPLDKNGKVDTSQVVIAYAGTNVGDDLDVLTDVQTVGLNKDTLTTSTRVEVPFNPNKPSDRYVTTTTTVDAQSVTALQFANEISKLYPNSRITTTGHSLGEYLALLVAAENQWVNVGFNGPDPYGV